jgi:maltose O-acetyltransferase
VRAEWKQFRRVDERGAYGAVTLGGARIGRRALAGAGAAVTLDADPGQTVVGNPARPLER